ncbi:ATPase, partial [Bacillus cereus]
EARQKALIDEASKYKYAEKKGMEKGREEGLQEGMEKGKEVGIQEGKIQLIQGMHKNGMDIEDIAKFTNMDMSEIRHILDH